MEAPANLVVLASGDNVGVALRDIAAGESARSMAGHLVGAVEHIPQGHKIAMHDIPDQALIIRFGMSIGIAKAAISKGHLVHVHNVASRYLNNDEDHYE